MAEVGNAQIKVTADGADEAANALKGVGNVLSGIGQIAGTVALAGIAALGSGLAFSIDAAMEAQTVMAQTNAVIASTGGAAGVTATQVTDLATQLMNMSGVSDEAIQVGQNLLLTFTNIGSDVFPMATQAMLDMSVAMGTDVKSGAIQLGKALNDPINGITALTRVGVTFTDAQKSMIKSMVEMGDVAGAQKVILAELSKEFGGSAEAAGQTAAGQFNIFKEQLGNIGEEIGMALLPVMGQLLGMVGPELVSALQATVPLVEMFANLLGRLADMAAVGNSPLAMLKVALESLLPAETADGIFNFVESLGPAFANMGASLETIGAQLSTFWAAHGEQIMANVSFTFNAIVGIISGALQLVLGVVAAFTAALNGDWSGAMSALESGTSGAIDAVAGIFGSSGAEIASTWAGIGDQINIITQAIATNIISAVSGAITGAVAKAAEAVKIGKALIDGITSAVMAGAGALIAALVGAVMDAINAAKAAAGISSPSKLAFASIGIPLAHGVAHGITAGAPKMAHAMRAATVGAASGGWGSTNTVNNTNSMGVYGPIHMNMPNGASVADLFAQLQSLQETG